MKPFILKTITLALLYTLLIAQTCPDKPSKVPSIPNFEGDQFPCSYSGFIPLKQDSDDQALFYWYFKNTSANEELPMLLWLNGGPGASSMMGLFHENGPLQFVQDADQQVKVQPRENSWLKYGHLLFVDQPKGTGFSYTDGEYIGTETQVAEDFTIFLKKFIDIHTETKTLNWSFIGESYGGKYIPSISVAVLKEKFIKVTHVGLVDPLVFALSQKTTSRNEIFGGLGLFDSKQMGSFNAFQTTCSSSIISGKYPEETTYNCAYPEAFIGNQTNHLNTLDIRNFQQPTKLVNTYFNHQNREFRKQIKESLHIENTPKNPFMFESDPEVYNAFAKTNDIYRMASVSNIKKILTEYKTPLIIMEGVTDVLDGVLSAQSYKQFIVDVADCKPRHLMKYKVGDTCQAYGVVQECSKEGEKGYNYNLAGVWNAGHLIPKDQLLASNFVLSNWLNGGNYCEEGCDCKLETQQKDICETFLNSCSKHGKCVTKGEHIGCQCDEGYFNADCSKHETQFDVSKDKLEISGEESQWQLYSLTGFGSLSNDVHYLEFSNPNPDLYDVDFYFSERKVGKTSEVIANTGFFAEYTNGQNGYLYLKTASSFPSDGSILLQLKITSKTKQQLHSNSNEDISVDIKRGTTSFGTRTQTFFLMENSGGFVISIVIFVIGVAAFIGVIILRKKKNRSTLQSNTSGEQQLIDNEYN